MNGASDRYTSDKCGSKLEYFFTDVRPQRETSVLLIVRMRESERWHTKQSKERVRSDDLVKVKTAAEPQTETEKKTQR